MLMGQWLGKYIKEMIVEYIICSIYEDKINAVILLL